MDWTTGNHPTVRGTTGDDAYPRPLGAADPLGAARATMSAIDAISAPLLRAMEQSERELGIVAEHHAAEQRVVDEAAPTGSRVEIFDDSATFGLLAVTVFGTLLSMFLTDRAAWNPFRLVPSLLRLRKNPFLQRDVVTRLMDYRREGFHPDDHPNDALVERWRAELFGEHGSLADHLH